MSWPWKKAKVSRISRIVADLQPSKPNSLVVQTGFPTSLVDLFVKNPDRLNKPIKKKKNKQQQQQRRIQPLVVQEVAISDHVPISNCRELTVEPVVIDKKCQSQDNLEGQHNNVDRCEVLASKDVILVSNQSLKGCGVVDDGNPGSNEKDKHLLFSVFKMFVLVALALSTTRITVGITMSAFLLIFLEYVQQRPFSSLKTCLLAFPRLIQRVFSLFRLRNIEEYGSASCGMVESLESSTPAKDITVVEPIVNMVGVEENGEVQNQNMYCLWTNDKKWESVDGAAEAEDDENEVLNRGEEHNQNGKIKRKIIKKLVPKKLRSAKKGKKEKEREADFRSGVSSSKGQDNLTRRDSIKEQYNSDHQLLVSKQKSQPWKLLEQDKREEREIFRTEGNKEFEHSPISSKASRTKPEMRVRKDMMVDIQRGGNSCYLILFLVVLAGLVGGRVLALVLTVASCFIVKLVWRRRKCEK